MMRKLLILAATLLMVALWQPLAAQPCTDQAEPPCLAGSDLSAYDGMMFAQEIGDPPGDAGPAGGPGEARRSRQARKHLEQLRILKMLEVLDLDNDQEIGFLTLFNGMRQTNEDLHARKQLLIDELMQALDSDENEDKLAELTRRIIDVERQRREADLKFMEDARRILTPRQVARLLVFHERFEAEMLQRVKTFHDRRGRGPDKTQEQRSPVPESN